MVAVRLTLLLSHWLAEVAEAADLAVCLKMLGAAAAMLIGGVGTMYEG